MSPNELGHKKGHKEAITKLTQSQKTLINTQSSLRSKLDEIPKTSHTRILESSKHFDEHLHHLELGRIWINKGNPFISLLLEEFHKSSLGGHMGLAKTLSKLKDKLFWQGMKQDVHHYILQKYVPAKSTGLLQPIPPW
ncbi:hypothetical protein CR513_28712, partial [Mucuna pruriens]